MVDRSQKNEFLVGLFILLGLALAGWMAFRLGNFSAPGRDGYEVTVSIRDVSGLRETAPVRLGGLEIGQVVSEPRLSDDFTHLLVDLRLNHDRRIPVGSEFRVGTSGLMGDSYVRITPPKEPATEFYAEGSVIEGDPAGSIDDVATGAVATLEQASQVLEEVGTSVQQLNEMFARVDEEVLDSENIENLRSVLASLKTSSDRIESASARLDPLLEETTQAVTEVREVAEGANGAFESVTSGVDQFSGTLARFDDVLGDVDSTLDQLKGTMREANGLLYELEHGNGLASALIRDSELREDLTSFVDKLDRSGILFYPRGSSRDREDPPEQIRQSAAPGSSGTSSEKKKLFPWLKRKSNER